MTLGAALVVRGDARRLPLPDESVDLIVTSPPYYALRSYTDDGEHYEGQIGSEDTWREWLEGLLVVTAECARVLKPSGSMFVDLGDKYSTGNSGQSGLAQLGEQYRGGGHSDGKAKRPSRPATDLPPKSLMLLPERYRIACVDHLGLIARAVIVWGKKNPLPESVTDRVRRSHEDWVHLTLRPRYYSAVDEIRQPYADRRSDTETAGDKRSAWHEANGVTREDMLHPLGALPGSVWTIPTEPLIVPDHLGIDHFAAFPSEWPRRFILGWSPPGICVDCGEGRRPVADRELVVDHVQSRRRGYTNAREVSERGSHGAGQDKLNAATSATIVGYACACAPYTDHPGTGEPSPTAAANGRQPARPKDIERTARKVGPWREYHFDRWTPPPTRPAVILDPFGGTGTTAAVARALGRIGVTVDLSRDYCRLAAWRTADPDLAAKVRGRMWRDRQLTLDGEAV